MNTFVKTNMLNVLPASKPATAKGLTLIELMVAVGILSMMILAFASIMASSRKVVIGSQVIMRGNTAAEAVGQTLRDSLRRATQNGFLCISTADEPGIPAADKSPQLLVCTSGAVDSKTGGYRGTGSISCYGLCPALPLTLSTTVLWHQEWILRPGTTLVKDTDVLNYDLSDVQAWPRASLVLTATTVDTTVSLLTNPAATYMTDAYYMPTDPADKNKPGIYTSPATLAEVNQAWKILATNCSNLEIAWTQGDTNTAGELIWYDKNNPSPTWAVTNTVASGTLEYNADTSGLPANARYRVLWTKDNQSKWPKAIRIRFALKDPLMLAEFSDTAGSIYEVICPVAR
jgi:prepilin-type N-terminal cleavage/methylation domain-containing protein